MEFTIIWILKQVQDDDSVYIFYNLELLHLNGQSQFFPDSCSG